MPILWPRFFRKTYVTFLGLARRGESGSPPKHFYMRNSGLVFN
ncbi:hypothetical protein PA39016_001160002 [Pseudomonas aeruginosa 39016]|nr:hypothetical protein CSB90_4523 [Pseudomonas aeruginosa]AWF02390.1 hypothetical protein CSC26_4582 [Pseudomonas aeruginosa]EFQ39120.1 hypothetical protein PA39016_001160002 [Pseudomonas aeruginosa 39016]